MRPHRKSIRHALSLVENPTRTLQKIQGEREHFPNEQALNDALAAFMKREGYFSLRVAYDWLSGDPIGQPERHARLLYALIPSYVLARRRAYTAHAGLGW